MISAWLGRLGRTFRGRRLDAELDEEIRAHLEMSIEEYLGRGMSAEEARCAARRDFGGVDQVKQRHRETRGFGGLEAWLSDIRLALKGLRRNPAFAAVALVTLALGIGANTALFSVVRGVFLQAPPVPNADRLVAVYTTCRAGAPRCASSYPDYLDYRDRTSTLEDLAGVSPIRVNMAESGRPPILAEAILVTGNYFNLLGLAPLSGRLIQPADDAVGAAAQVVVISHASWTAQFGSDPEVVGRSLALNGSRFEIVGVTPQGFRGTALTDDPDLFIPITVQNRLRLPPTIPSDERMAQITQADLASFSGRGNRWISRLIGRLAPGVTASQAYDELVALSETLREENPDARGPRSVTLDPAVRYILPESARAELPRFVLLVGMVVGLTLLLACANIANLLLARGAVRLPEIAIRRALGAGRKRVIRQLMTESTVLGVLGGALGLAVAWIFIDVLSPAALPGGVQLGRLGLSLDWSVLLFALVVSVMTSVMFGLVPALRVGSTGLQSALRGEGGHHSTAGNQLRKALVGVQTGLCIVLLVGSGLFLQTVRNGLTHDLGFNSENLSLLRFNLQPLGLTGPEALYGLRQVEERMTSLPGVRSATIATRAPFEGGGSGVFFEISDYVPAPDEELRLEWVGATAGALSTFQIPVETGTDITDGRDALVWINRTMAERYFGGGAIGRGISLLGAEFTVAGVFADVDWDEIGEETINNAIVPLEVVPERAAQSTIVAVRLGDEGPQMATLRDQVRAVFPDVTFLATQTSDELLRAHLAPQRLAASLLLGMGALALTLAAIGIAGVVGYLVNQRRRDLGLRLALGASRGRLVSGLVQEMALPIFGGALIGMGTSVVVGRIAQSFLFGVTPGDARTLAGVMLLFCTIAMFAVLFPARQAARIPPAESLRQA